MTLERITRRALWLGLTLALLTSAASSRPIDVAAVGSDVTSPTPNPSCFFSTTCTITVNDIGAPIFANGGRVQSRETPVGEPGTLGAGLYLHLYRVTLLNAFTGGPGECVDRLEIPTGPIVPFDYDVDGTFEFLFDVSLGGSIGSVPIQSAERLGDFVRVHFAGGLCPGANPGTGASSFMFGFASPFPPTLIDGEVAFDSTGTTETIPLLAPDVPTDAFDDAIAYAWADQPTAASYTPNTLYSHNPTGGGIVVERSDVGAYRVLFGALGAVGGAHTNLQVSAYGGTNGSTERPRCVAGGFGADRADVRCYDAVGDPIDSRFTVLLSKPSAGSMGIGSVLALHPATASYAPAADEGFNGGGGAITIDRHGTGSYVVHFEGLAAVAGHIGGTAYVTTWNDPTARCRPTGWTMDRVGVECLDTSGSPRDAAFSLLYYLPWDRFEDVAAYAWAGGGAGLLPDADFYYARNPQRREVTQTRTGPGEYRVQWEDLEREGGFTFGGTVQVSAYGTAASHCKIRSWQSDTAFVECFDHAGALADSMFSVSYLRPTPVPEPAAIAGLTAGLFGLSVLARRRRSEGPARR